MHRPLLIVVCVAMPSLAQGGTYHVAMAGSDANTCAQATDSSTGKRTIAAGLACLAAGDTLVVGQGIYPEVIPGTDIPNGTASAYTTVAGAQGQTVVINGTTSTDVVTLTDRSYVTLRNLTIDGKNAGIMTLAIRRTAHHIRLESNVVRNSKDTAIGMRDEDFNKTNLHIVNNVLHDNGGGPTDTLGENHSIYLRGIKDSLIEGNTIYNGTGYGVRTDVTRGAATITRADNLIIRNNRIYNHRAGINVGGGTNIQVYNNLVYNNTVPLGTAVAAIYVNNGSPSQAKIYNNTIVGNRGKCVSLYQGTGHAVMNNICWQNTDNTMSSSVGGNTLSHNLFTDPSFVDLARGNFAISATSVAVDAGVLLSAVTQDYVGVPRPQGTAYDIGAHERQKLQTVTPPSAPTNVRVLQ